MQRPASRNLLVAIAIAAILVGAARWLTRPRIDPRLLGRWTIHDGQTTWPIQIYEFRSDGTATIWQPVDMQNSSYDPTPIRWRMESDKLSWRHDDGIRELLFQWYLRLRYRFWDQKLKPPPDNVFEIVHATQDEIQVDVSAGQGPPSLEILRRTK